MKNITEKLQRWSSKSSIQLFSAPYLPSGLIWAALLLAYTDLMVLLLGQPAGYWMDRERASSSFSFLEDLLSAGILSYGLVGLLYVVLLWLLLTILTRSFALALWIPFSLIHLNHILSWLIGKTKLTGELGWTQEVAVSVNAISALILGIILATTLLGHTRPGNESAGFKRWVKPFALGTWVVVLIAVVSISAIWPRGGWARLHPKHAPGPRALAASAYDPVRQRVVLFGGVSEWLGTTFAYEQDTWEWDGNDWLEMKPKTAPSVRAGHMMAYDEKRGEVILFGGEDKSGSYMLADTWIWDGKDWKQMSPTGYPVGRRGGQLFYDPQSEKVILAGGFYFSSGKVVTPLNDIWAWNGTDWEYMTSLQDNLLITNPNVAYDPLQQRITLFDYKKVMTWTDGKWSEIEVGTKPPSRFGTWLAADPKSGKMLIFGGIENNVRLNDTWAFEGGDWKELHPALTPAPRDGHIMFFDPARNSFILYGGISTQTVDDMWEYVLP